MVKVTYTVRIKYVYSTYNTAVLLLSQAVIHFSKIKSQLQGCKTSNTIQNYTMRLRSINKTL